MPTEWTVSLGEATEQLREKYDITRDRQDAFAARSHRLADQAWSEGSTTTSSSQVPGVELSRDESIRPDTTVERLAGLKTSFRKEGGTVTAGNASPLNDGASAVLLGSERAQDRIGLEPIARIAGRGASANEPQFFGYAPVEAANRALARAGISWDDVSGSRAERGLRRAVAGVHRRLGRSIRTSSTGTAARSPSGTRSAPPAGASSAPSRVTSSAPGERWGVACICIGVGQGLAVVLENVTSR